MTALIVGGDYVEPLKREIRAHGHARVEHWDGRKSGFAKKAIPGGTRLIVVLIDYIGHNLLVALKRQAGRNNVPLLYCRRSANDLRRKLDDIRATESGSCRRPGLIGNPAVAKNTESGALGHLGAWARTQEIVMGLFTDKDALARIQAATDYPLQRADDGWVVGHFFNCRLSSAFQPVFDISERRVIGHGAYVRSESIGSDGGGDLSPWGIFALAAEDPLLVRLDRLCRTLHSLNYFSRASAHQELYVSVQSRLLESVKDGHGRAFEKVLDLIGVETSRVVIEIPLEVNQDRRLLKHVIVNYRSRGYRIACNHSGATEEWMAELGSLYPDVMKLDVKALKRSGSRALVDAIHRFGASLLVKEVETPEDVSAAVRAGADLLQGRYLGEPARAIESVSKRAAAELQHPGYAW